MRADATPARIRRSARRLPVALLLIAASPGPAAADGVLDGSLGEPGSVVSSGIDPQDGAEANYLVLRNYGEQRGGNLFHSFSEFNVGSGETATFTQFDSNGNPASTRISNVFSRITAQQDGNAAMSRVEGTLRSSIPGANFFLLNAEGVLFGPGSNIDVDGSFAVASADVVRFEDGAFLTDRAEPLPAGDVLAADPVAFGFTRAEIGPILVTSLVDPEDPENSDSVPTTLQVKTGETFSIAGGDISVQGPDVVLEAPEGTLQIASLGGPAEVPLPNFAEFDVSGRPRDQLGAVALLNDVNVAVALGNGAGRGGRVVIRGGELVLRASSINSNAELGAPDLAIDVQVAGDVDLDEGSSINTSTSSGQAGDIVIEAERVRVAGGSQIASGVLNFSEDTGEAGAISVSADRIDVEDAGETDPEKSSTIGQPRRLFFFAGGDVTLEAREIRIADLVRTSAGLPSDGGAISIRGETVEITGEVLSEAVIESDNVAGGIEIVADRRLTVSGGGAVTTIAGIAPGGNVDISAGDVVIETGDGPLRSAVSRVQALSQVGATGAAGDINIRARRGIRVDRGTVSATGRAGPGGDITLHADEVDLSRGGLVTASTGGSADAGSVSVTANVVRIDGVDPTTLGGSAPVPSAITAQSLQGASGGAGSVNVKGRKLFITNGGRITVSSFAANSGPTGDIDVQVRNVSIVNSRDAILAESNSDNDAGNISIRADSKVRIRDGSINSRAVRADASGGNITIEAGKEITLVNSRSTARITPKQPNIVADVSGNESTQGGNVRLVADYIAVKRSGIVANATQGQGGNISIEPRSFFFVADGRLRETSPGRFENRTSVFDVSGQLEAGDFEVRAPDSVVVADLTRLSEDFLDVTDLLSNECDEREAPAGSLFLRGRDRAPAAPDEEPRILFGTP